MSKFIVNSFQVPNAVHDEVMPHLGDAALRCYITIIRQTLGWQKTKDKISISQFMKKTGRSRHSVIRGVDELVKLGLIKKELVGSSNGKTAEYSVNLEISQCQFLTSAESAPVPKVHMTSAESDTSPVPKVHTQKDTITKETITKDTVSATTERMNYKGYGEAFNAAVTETNVNMPMLATPGNLNKDRKGKLKAFVTEYNQRFKKDSGEMTPDKFKAYVLDFINQAKCDPRGFYFGNNDRNWRADFEHLLKIKTFDKVIEGAV